MYFALNFSILAGFPALRAENDKEHAKNTSSSKTKYLGIQPILYFVGFQPTYKLKSENDGMFLCRPRLKFEDPAGHL